MALGHPVEQLVVGQDQVGAGRQLEPLAIDAAALEHVDLVEQHLRVDHHAVADDRGDVVVEHARRDELEGERLAVDDERVPGVVPTLVADDQVHLLGEEVGELALALVAPLGSDHDGRRHVVLLLSRLRGRERVAGGLVAGVAPRGAGGHRGTAPCVAGGREVARSRAGSSTGG